MMKLQTLATLAAGIALTGVAFVRALGAFDTNHAAARAADVDADLLNDARSNFQPFPQDMATPEFPITPSRVELGRKLFFDPRISVDGTVSCARCHQPALYGRDGLPKARGAHDKLNPRKAPTVLNAALQFKAHWRGDRENVEDEAKQVLIGPFSFINPDYASAMARIDAFLAGDARAVSPEERTGLRKFIDTGCTACHNGVDVGGGIYQKFGIVEDYWTATRSQQPDKGRFDVTHDPQDTYVFKVPSLRNVAMTPPYFHDGSVRSLPEAVRIMAKVQLGRPLTDQARADIVAFLGGPTRKLPPTLVYAPMLPASGFDVISTDT